MRNGPLKNGKNINVYCKFQISYQVYHLGSESAK